jgi:hypothetical protein
LNGEGESADFPNEKAGILVWGSGTKSSPFLLFPFVLEACIGGGGVDSGGVVLRPKIGCSTCAGGEILNDSAWEGLKLNRGAGALSIDKGVGSAWEVGNKLRKDAGTFSVGSSCVEMDLRGVARAGFVASDDADEKRPRGE